ncbi:MULTISPECIES: aminodeoxychorismate synthase component I [unclassified Devosia]|uniref:aminodeoxychorismate synthase component I n=1 Tax=unclassified Devosia TaxID=196773 RepID=UPI001557CFE1|nr:MULTISPECIES: aminodeoxychorismate synthase component I [unclassified Devosia]
MFAPGSVLLHDNLAPDGTNLLFTDPHAILVAHTSEEARRALAELERAKQQGFWAAGFLSYELGFLFEERLEPLLPERSPFPLLWLGLYSAPQRLSAGEVDQRLDSAIAGQGAEALDLVPSRPFADYALGLGQVQQWIGAGDTYQVNLTFKARFRLEGHPAALYRDLARKQQVAYGALINTGEHWILSRSPELFVASTGGTLSARPMKGTRRRAGTIVQDEAGRAALAADPKNRAENLMIVDLLRNDLSRISAVGSVEVTDLFSVQTLRTLHTMTSGITAQRLPDVSTTQLLAQLFPCGSITGAPKLRAMEIIAAVEAEPRGLYTGSIGYFAPNGDLTLNVAIRTAVIDGEGRGEIGIGGGIVADSVAEDEYEEALLKMAFLADKSPPICLIETLRWTNTTSFWLLERHLDRIAASAQYFNMPFDRYAATSLLTDTAAGWSEPAMRVRLTLDQVAGLGLSATPLPANPAQFRFAVAEERLDSGSLWLAHKTTNRAFYDEPRQRAAAVLGVDEVVFLNERGELTEGSITSLFLREGGVLLTPPAEAGLLPGTLRAELLATGAAREARLTLDDLANADAIYLGNSVRGLLRASWIHRPSKDAT